MMWLVVTITAALAEPRTEGNLVIDGVPALSAEVVECTAQYDNVRSAALLGWTPNGEVLLSTRFGETSQVHSVATAGAARQQLTFFAEPVAGATFDPRGDGRSFVYSRDVGGAESWQLFRFDLATGRSTLLSDGASRNELGPWSHTPGRMAFSSTRRNAKDFDLWVMDVSAPESARRVLEVEGQWNVLDWSRDDSRMLVRQYVSISESRVHVLDLASGQLTPVALPGVSESWSSAHFGPGDATVLGITDGGGEYERLVSVDLATGARREHTADISWNVAGLARSLDGARIAFTVNEGGRSALYLAAASSPERRVRVVVPPGTVDGLAFDHASRRLALTLSTAQSPSDVFVLDVRKPKLARWTSSELGGLDPATFVTPELVSFPSFDGLQVPAWVYRPRDQKGPSPVVIAIHGGPEGQTRDRFSSTWQYWVNELGLTVIAPNVRGSDGYGRTYVGLDNGMKRQDSVRDIGALLDWIAAQPDLDAERVGVAGGSYGGFMVLASMVAYPDRLRCGVDSVGISNFVSFLENTEAYRRDLRRAEYGDERDPEMRAFLEQVSPLNHVDRIEDPLFVVQGANDPRVPRSEAEQIVRSLRERERTVWYLLAMDEGHGFRKKSNRDYLARATTLFFDAYLVGAD
jgi:dipeptidyl aminopeptidase/acylaminoacyl peptidase